MIRKAFTTYEQIIHLALLEEWIGKSIELIAFALPAEAEPSAHAACKEMTILQLPQIPCYFDWGELYE